MSSAKIATNPFMGGMGGPRTLVGPSSSSGSSSSAPRRNVCKNLFGAPDRTNSFAADRMRELRAISEKKWNFNFEREEPLPGRYVWEKVRPGIQSSIPSAYGLNRMKIGSGLQMVKSRLVEQSQASYYEASRLPEGSLLIVAAENARVPAATSATTTITVSHIESQSFAQEIRNPNPTRIATTEEEVEEQSGTSVNNPETCLNPPQQQQQVLSESESSSGESSQESSNVQVTQKRKKQTQLSDYFKNTKHDVGMVKKRKAESPTSTTAPPEKKATL